MPTPPKVMSGARAKIGFSVNGVTSFVGIYNNFSYGVTYDVAPAYILGRYTAASLDYTSVEIVQCSASAYRVIKHGPHVEGRLPSIKDLLDHNTIEIVVFDRVTSPGAGNKPIATIRNVRPTGYSTALSARQLEEMTMTYVGILVDDEDTTNAEVAGSTELP